MEYVKLKDICDFINGDRGKNYPKSSEFIDDGIPFINAGHIEGSRVSFSKMNYISEGTYEKLGSGKIQNRDIIFCLRGSLGKSALIDFDKGAIASSLVILRNKNELRLNTSYLMYILNSNEITLQIRKTDNGSSQPNLSANSVKNYIIPLPSIEVQDSIVKILDKAQSLIDKRKAQITALSELTQSVFLEMFGDPKVNPMNWEVHCLGELVENLNSKRVPIKATDREKIQGDFPYYGATGIVDYINDYKLDGEYLLVSEDGKALESRNKPIAFLANGKFWVNNHAHILAYNGKCNLRYLSIYIENISIENYITGIDQYKLNRANLDKIPVMYPPIELQERFNQILKRIEEQKLALNMGLIELKKYYNSMLQRAFKGELFND